MFEKNIKKITNYPDRIKISKFKKIFYNLPNFIDELEDDPISRKCKEMESYLNFYIDERKSNYAEEIEKLIKEDRFKKI